MGRRGLPAVIRPSQRRKQVRALRYLSPPSMVAAVAERRRAGDWRGVCAAGLVDAHVDLSDVATRYGAEDAARVESDLLGFAPDLLRRFVPRLPSLALLPRARIVLSRLPGEIGDRALLVADLPPDDRVRQRIALRVVSARDLGLRWYDLPDWCWHADAVAARRWAYGASADRLAWHDADGDPYPPGTPAPQLPADRADEVERLAELLTAGRVTAAYEAVGCAIDPTPVRRLYREEAVTRSELAELGAALPVLAAESRRLANRYGRTPLRDAFGTVEVDVAPDGDLTIRAVRWDGDSAGPVAFGTPAPVDVALLRAGLLAVDDLHPLVHDALFPGRVQAPPAAPAAMTWPEFRVRCGADWHQVLVVEGRIVTPWHTEWQIDRELLFAGLGGEIVGCAAAVRGFRTGAKRVPTEVRKIRRDLFALAFHGDTDSVLAIVAAGLDPALHDGEGGTLMHWLHHLDHRRALPALLAAGLSVAGQDNHGETPLHRAAGSAATDVMGALVEAGADPDAVDRWGRTATQVLAQVRSKPKR
ncbi:ankyrin repeat domain-containing protein [Polymorphospora rubra]|uniref:ankyrin repeat domain-containing protein n=1 Tax=Polymorphospora rubra TaxID=338584 RepID=UPI0033E0F3F3